MDLIMDSKKRIKDYISQVFPEWEKVDYSIFNEEVEFNKDLSDLFRINKEEIILISYTNISITGSERPKPQLRVFLDEYKKPFYFAKKHQLRYYLFSIFTKEDEMAKGLDQFNPKEYIISIETNLDIEGSRRDLRSIYDYANENLKGRKFLKCTRSNYKVDINQASFIYIGTADHPDKTTFESFINIFDSRPYLNSNIDRDKIISFSPSIFHPQLIFYGAPGTGKSHATNEIAAKYPDTIRTTFHPDSDYSTFVGAYKPTMEEVEVKTVPVVVAGGITLEQNKGTYKEKKIAYRFVKQAFLKAYVKAWKLFKETCVEGGELAPQFLVIEEINRGNCAQIFGDLFQLLDRKNGFSEYPVEADADICKALLEEDTDDNPSFGTDGLQLTDEQKAYVNNVYGGKPVVDKICKGEVLVLPPNLYIWATMNTSDQSLFPIDSAFKRRWEWKYMKIKQGYKRDENGKYILDTEEKKIPLGWEIKIKDKDGQLKHTQDWWAFVQKINEIIASMTSSADKQLGYFFCKADKDGVISGETFVSKVVFYLWNDVFKDYGFEDASLFRYKVKEGEKEAEKDLTFPDFYDEDGEKVNADRLVDFIQKVMAWQKSEENA